MRNTTIDIVSIILLTIDYIINYRIISEELWSNNLWWNIFSTTIDDNNDNNRVRDKLNVDFDKSYWECDIDL